MLHLVGIKRKSLQDYDALMAPDLAEEIRGLGTAVRDELRLFAEMRR